jgi:hypothetical protein
MTRRSAHAKEDRIGSSEATIGSSPYGAVTTLIGITSGDRPRIIPIDMSDVITIFKTPLVGHAVGPSLKITATSGMRKSP